mmetsp:Transcript_24024/g.57122  ORF Transcript_24024/g.57122 Transcript_24024/m.57122 type:complete len:204 (-) Transcript_24024:352-963(-)
MALRRQDASGLRRLLSMGERPSAGSGSMSSHTCPSSVHVDGRSSVAMSCLGEPALATKSVSSATKRTFNWSHCALRRSCEPRWCWPSIVSGASTSSPSCIRSFTSTTSPHTSWTWRPVLRWVAEALARLLCSTSRRGSETKGARRAISSAVLALEAIWRMTRYAVIAPSMMSSSSNLGSIPRLMSPSAIPTHPRSNIETLAVQ